jgi:hypothetical protein
LPQKNFGNKKAPDFRQALSVKFVLVRLPAATFAAATVSTAAAATATTAAAATATTVAAATAAATAATVAAATAAITAAATAVAATTTWGTSFTRTRFVHGQRPAFDRLAVEFLDRLLRILFRGHGHEGKAARLPGELVLHERDFLHRACLGEEILEIGLRRVEGKISYVEFCSHLSLLWKTLHRSLFPLIGFRLATDKLN